MSFLDKARQAAEQAKARAEVLADKAAVEGRKVAEQARSAASEGAERATELAHRADATLQDPATADRARAALGRARRGLATAIERIDPNVLADVVIRATALQEKTNQALRAKESAYRISEISIGASIPPSVTFAIARIGDDGDASVVPTGAEVSSISLAESLDEPPVGEVEGLDGERVSEDALPSAR